MLQSVPSKTTAPRARFWARKTLGTRLRRRRFLPRVDLMEDRSLLSTLTVTNNKDSGSGSLRALIAAASSGDTIKFASSLNGQTIKLTTGELDITTSLNIDGPGSGLNGARITDSVDFYGLAAKSTALIFYTWI